MSDEHDRRFPCTHCGAQCPCREDVVERHWGQRVTLWCETCGNLFDVEMPPKGGTSG